MLGYRHTPGALLKMIKRFKNKINHPMYGKTDTEEAKNLIRKLGEKIQCLVKNIQKQLNF